MLSLVFTTNIFLESWVYANTSSFFDGVIVMFEGVTCLADLPGKMLALTRSKLEPCPACGCSSCALLLLSKPDTLYTRRRIISRYRPNYEVLPVSPEELILSYSVRGILSRLCDHVYSVFLFSRIQNQSKKCSSGVADEH